VKFAQPFWLFGTGVAVLVAALLIAGGILALRAVHRFGDEPHVLALVTGRASVPRAIKGVLLVLAVALGFLALAQPQYGRGTRLVPATDLDVVIVLDYSKSMFARDVPPSRSVRAKSEVARLISELPGARFAAVAFAGQPMSFPLTSDGGAIAQFFRQLSPNDMPVGGTAIARALEAGRELLARDPLSKKHRRVLLLVTDGEDLEGDPVSVAQAAARDGITIHVVQIGGRTPEPLPEVDEAGEVVGMRSDEEGKPITTALSADGEAQLARIAEVGSGRVVRSERGETGIREVANSLKRMMSEELSERVETVYADVYMYPLGLAILLLLVETFISEVRRRSRPTIVPPPPKQRRVRVRRDTRRAAAAAAAALCSLVLIAGCERGLDGLFVRNAPAVDDAIEALDAGDAGAAVGLLEDYLSTGTCSGGNIGTPDGVRTRPSASFDLGLGLFKIAEQFGRRFGEEQLFADAGMTPEEEARLAARSEQVECALRIVRLIGADVSVPIELRARAHYLAGNLEFLRREYRSAVAAYDLALRLIPGLPEDAGDAIGRDAAWNRAIALRRIEEQERDSGQDGSPDAAPDAQNQDDAAQDSRSDSARGDGSDPSQNQDNDAGSDAESQSQPDAGASGGPDAAPEPQPQPQQQQQQPSVSQDENMLDMLERAPTLQQHDARTKALQRQGRGMEDK
jgi:Ca-activated chloride channel family protein